METEFTLRRMAERVFYNARGWHAEKADIEAIEDAAAVAIDYVKRGHGTRPWMDYMDEVAHFARNNGHPSGEDFEKWMFEGLD